MRILTLSNLYPPTHLGGMELRLQETIQGLQERGHQCQVLTSDFVPPGIVLSDEPGVARFLSLDADVYHYKPLHYVLNRQAQLRQNVEAFKNLARAFRPDLVFFWCMWNLSPALIATAKALFPGRVVQSFAGYWPVEPDAHEQYWLTETPGRITDVIRRLLAPLVLSRWYRPVRWSDITFEHAVFVSQYVYDYLGQAGLVFPHAKVIFSGIETDEFIPAHSGASTTSELRVLCAGGWARHKGAHTVIEAIRLLDEQGVSNISLTVIGRGHPNERVELEALVRDAHLEGRVVFRTAVARDNMPDVYREHDVLVVATLSAEPLARTVMEGMASGLTVVASATGGTPEMIADGRDGLLFAPGDSRQLSVLLQRLVEAPDLRERLAAAARVTAVARFDIRRMVDEIEGFLEEVVAQIRYESI
ncbi:MAG: glycosyltransferase family 4 protein [Anaerolineae bacterium]|nr:glycosyltransferase family 4 protein [Anaerolineae bacterium]